MAIGTSAGGLEPLKRFFAEMPHDSGIGFAVVTHLDPGRESMLAELIGRHTRMAVRQAEEGARVEPNTASVIPPNVTLTIEHGTLHTTPHPGRRHRIAPIDVFFRSMAEDQGPYGVCIVLSGTGSDGTLGLKAVKEHGGMAMAQVASGAEYGDMPTSAAETGLVDHVLPVEEMPRRLLDYVEHLDKVDGEWLTEDLKADSADHLTTRLALIRARTGHDFTNYKMSTVLRRVQRRMQVMHTPRPADYVSISAKAPRRSSDSPRT